ncbi:Actin protein 8 [Paragonimus kellicotti]|nr:Actin protein 8 [Paragonimus kellicotti]
MADLESLRVCLQTAEKEASDLLFPACGSGRKNDGDRPFGSSMNLSIPLLWPCARKQIVSLPINVLTVLYANILPFACVNFTAEPFCKGKPGIFYECQLPSLDSSQPDDPFDDLFINLTARERRKRNPGQTNAVNDPATLETTSETKTADANDTQTTESIPPQSVTNPPSASQNPCEAFDSLVAAIWWSVSQCASSVGCQTLLDPSTVPHYPVAPVSQVALEETRRRLLSSILLVGGGACGFAGQCLKKWLVAGLTAKYSTAASHTSDYTGSRPPVDVIVQRDSSDAIAWCGARVVLTADSLNDMWITSTEWRKLGSRVLREKAPFLW